ncbi:MAG: CCA-adding enzyme [Candidatus Hydrogenedentes bacterium ADurb.Bin101]|nr:MAG: CCA-adding enzyme [Candidatus Hydrogenedentes bacterium ADurb.Bin101]
MNAAEHNKQGAFLICKTLSAHGYRALFAGGCVRDFLLHIPPADIDIATSASPAEVVSLFSRTVTVGAKFGVVMVLLPQGAFEVATFRRDGPYLDGRHPSEVCFTGEREDAQRRDFTINALFFDPETEQVIDYVDGRDDLRSGIIRAVGTPRQRFQEDALRLLRAVRFAARFNFQIEAATWQAICAEAVRIHQVSVERIREELLKMLTEGRARLAFELLNQSGLLARVLPEIDAMKGVEQPAGFHPEGDVFQHTLLCLEHLPEGASPSLAFAVLLHDAGKPGTQTFEDRIRFNWHEKAGARIAEEVCRRLRMPSRDVERIAWLVENHMRLKDFSRMREHRRRRLVRMPGFEELLALCRIDALASHKDLSLMIAAENYLHEHDGADLQSAPLLKGHDLIEMGYAPGPRFRKILHAIESLQLEGTLRDKSEAEAYVRTHFPCEDTPPD